MRLLNQIIKLFLFSPKKQERSFTAIDKSILVKFRQCFETSYIINTSLNHDIIRERMFLLEDRLSEIIEATENYSKPEFERLLIKAIDGYKADYYDKTFESFQLDVLISAETRKRFYGESVLSAFNRYKEKQEQQIQNLKTDKAKENRREKIKEVAGSFIWILEDFCHGTERYTEIRDILAEQSNDEDYYKSQRQ